MGRAAFFVRTFGCPLHCPWCDSAGTWHKQYVPKNVEKIDEQALALEAARSGAPIVVVTGGEPAIHNLQALVWCCKLQGLRVHLETSGAFPIRGAFDWITLSPKEAKAPLPECVAFADEFKVIVDHPAAIQKMTKLIWSLGAPDSSPIWLHPEWSQREDPEILGAIVEAVKAHPHTFRAGWQVHKLFAADKRDARSADPVPLGGNPTLGY